MLISSIGCMRKPIVRLDVKGDRSDVEFKSKIIFFEYGGLFSAEYSKFKIFGELFFKKIP